MSLSFRLTAVLCGLLVAAAAEASAVYKWTDDKGVVQYTDAPPEGRKFEKLDVGGAGSRAERDRPAPTPAPDDSAPSPAQQRLATMRANCEAARKNLQTMEQFEVVTADTDNDGVAETLDAETRQRAIDQNRELVRQYCLDEGADSRNQEGEG
jgi:hypothetical protein